MANMSSVDLRRSCPLVISLLRADVAQVVHHDAQADAAAPPSIGTPSARERSARQFTFDDGDDAEHGKLNNSNALIQRVLLHSLLLSDTQQTSRSSS